jgi:uncharacterized radical SAM protein YgiQ
MEARGWEQADFLFVSGDAYVDHPSFAPAVIGRVLEAEGYKVAILAQPDWHDPSAWTAMGKPRLGVLVCGGNLDSMLCHYTAARKPRTVDKYTPGGVMGRRPDHATAVYARMAKRLWPDLPVIIGGIEASLRRFAHYDYWEDKLFPSILADCGADLLICGMGEKAVREVAAYLSGGAAGEDLHYIRGTAFVTDSLDGVEDYVLLPSYEDIRRDKVKLAEAYHLQNLNFDPFYGKTLVQETAPGRYVVQNPAVLPLTEAEMDAIYDLPYTRQWHPMYDAAGGVPALEEVKFSIVSCRGCFGSCSFCAIHAHQGRIIQARSHASILREARELTTLPDFKGYINDVGGPTANFRHPACAKQRTQGACSFRQCLFPEPCPNLDADHSDYVALLRELRALPGVKKVFIRSGIRYDYLLADKKRDFLDELCRYHVSGQLKVAPEHIAPPVLKRMGKPGKEVYLRFVREFQKKTGKSERNSIWFRILFPVIQAVPCGMPWSWLSSLRDTGRRPEQVQDFIPTPGSASTAMYYSGVDPYTMEKVYVTRNPHEKAMQRALMQYTNPRNYRLVVEALRQAGREDLIGHGRQCLVPPDGPGPVRPRHPGPENRFGRRPAGGSESRGGSRRSARPGKGKRTR